MNDPAAAGTLRLLYIDDDPEQRLLVRLALERLGGWQITLAGSADGVIGLKTRKAIRTFQLQVGLPADGFATKAFLDELRRHASS